MIGGEGEEIERPGVREVLLARVPELVVREVHADAGHDLGEAACGELRSLYVLAGELTARVGELERALPAGSWFQIPAGETLALAVAADEPARFLDVRT